MKLSYLSLALLGVCLMSIGIYRAASASAVGTAEQFDLTIESPAFLLSEKVAVGLVGSLVIAHLVEQGKKTVMLSMPNIEQADPEAVIDAH
jgi:hypothetical protein